MSTPQNVARLNTAIEDRARELKKSLNQVARDAGITTETLSALRGKGKRREPGSRPYDRTARGIDHALQWPEGTTMAIWDGQQLPADTDELIAEIRAADLRDDQKDLLISMYRSQQAAQKAATLQQLREWEEQRRRGA